MKQVVKRCLLTCPMVLLTLNALCFDRAKKSYKSGQQAPILGEVMWGGLGVCSYFAVQNWDHPLSAGAWARKGNHSAKHWANQNWHCIIECLETSANNGGLVVD